MNKLDKVLEQQHPKYAGIWIYEKDREKILNMLKEITNGFWSIFDYKALILFAVLTVCVFKFKKIHPIVFIALGAVCGIVFGM